MRSSRLLFLQAAAFLLFLITSFLADYTVMNLVLLLILFVFGFLIARIPGVIGVSAKNDATRDRDFAYISHHPAGAAISRPAAQRCR